MSVMSGEARSLVECKAREQLRAPAELPLRVVDWRAWSKFGGRSTDASGLGRAQAPGQRRAVAMPNGRAGAAAIGRSRDARKEIITALSARRWLT
jgi:hypothetical protein